MKARKVLWLSSLALFACMDPRSISVPPLEYALESSWPGLASVAFHSEDRLLVTNNLDDTLSFFRLGDVGTAPFEESYLLPVGLNPVELEGPHHAALDPSGEFYYIGISNYTPGSGSGPHGAHGAGTTDGYVLKYRASDHALVANVRVDRNPGDLVLSADGKTLFVSHFDLLKISDAAAAGGAPSSMDARLAIVDAESMTRKAMVPLCPAPHGIRPSLDGSMLFATCLSDEVAAVNLQSPDYPVTRIKVALNAGTAVAPVHQPYALTVSPLNGEIWVSCLSAGDVHVLDPHSLQFDSSRTVNVGGSPMFGAVTPEGRFLVPHQGDDRISEIQTSNGQKLREFSLPAGDCLNVHQLMLLPNSNRAVVVCEGDHRNNGSVVVMDRSTGDAVGHASVGVFPDFVGILPGHP